MQKSYCMNKGSQQNKLSNMLKMHRQNNRYFIDCGQESAAVDLTKICQAVKSHRTNVKTNNNQINKNLRIIAIKPRSLRGSSTSLNHSFRRGPTTVDNQGLHKKRIQLFSNKENKGAIPKKPNYRQSRKSSYTIECSTIEETKPVRQTRKSLSEHPIKEIDCCIDSSTSRLIVIDPKSVALPVQAKHLQIENILFARH